MRWEGYGRLAYVRLFSRSVANDDSDDSWAIAQGVIDGHRVIVRSKAAKRDRSRPVKVTVKIGVARPDADGLPELGELKVMADIEDILVRELADYGAELVLVITGNYAREFIAYSASTEWLPHWGPSLISRWGHGRPGTGLAAELEPDWATYRAFAIR